MFCNVFIANSKVVHITSNARVRTSKNGEQYFDSSLTSSANDDA